MEKISLPSATAIASVGGLLDSMQGGGRAVTLELAKPQARPDPASLLHVMPKEGAFLAVMVKTRSSTNTKYRFPVIYYIETAAVPSWLY